MTLPAYSAERRRLQEISIDECLIDGTDRRTDGQPTVTYILLHILCWQREKATAPAAAMNKQLGE